MTVNAPRHTFGLKHASTAAALKLLTGQPSSSLRTGDG